MRKIKFLVIILTTLLSSQLFGQIKTSSSLKSMELYYSSFNAKRRIGISAKELENKASHYIKLNDLSADETHVINYLEGLKKKEKGNILNMNHRGGCRIKMIIKFIKRKESLTIYFTQGKTMYVNGVEYEFNDELITMFKIIY